VNVLAVRDDFWSLGLTEPPAGLEGRRVVLNQSLAEDLGAARGEAVLLTVGRRGAAPKDTIFGRRSRQHTVRAMRVIVSGVLPPQGLARFTLRSDEPRPRNLYVSLPWLQRQLGRQGRVSTLLLGSAADGRATPGDGRVLARALASAARLEDYGLRLLPNRAYGYVSLESDGLVVPEGAVNAALKAARGSGAIPAR